MRGYAEIQTKRWLEALADFRYARLLEPKLAIVPFDEGRGWIGSNSRLTLDAWTGRLATELARSAERTLSTDVECLLRRFFSARGNGSPGRL
jgi:hypothetical protein